MSHLQCATVSVSLFIFFYQYLDLKKSLVGSGGMDLEPHKYWAKKNHEGRLMIYDHPSMEQPRLEYRDGKICLPRSILCRRIEIVSGKIYRAGGATPLWRVEGVRKN